MGAVRGNRITPKKFSTLPRRNRLADRCRVRHEPDVVRMSKKPKWIGQKHLTHAADAKMYRQIAIFNPIGIQRDLNHMMV